MSVESGVFKPVKKVSLKYNSLTSELEVLDLDFARVQFFILREIVDLGFDVAELMVVSCFDRTSKKIHILFRERIELEAFMKGIEEAESFFSSE